MNILIIEDDCILAQQIQKFFLRSSLCNRAVKLHNYTDFLTHGISELHITDIVLLDICIDGINQNTGFSILEHIRSIGMDIPIIIISGYSDCRYLEKAFILGANDYIIKPFRTKELFIRVKKWFHLYQKNTFMLLDSDDILDYYDLVYDMFENEFYVNSKRVSLTKGNKFLFFILFQHREKIVSKIRIIEKIWGYNDIKNYENALRVKILRLKEQLTGTGLDTWIHIVPGSGYMLHKGKL